MWMIFKDTVGLGPIKLMALVKKGQRWSCIYFCLNAFNLMNWKFKGKEQIESHLVNICFPWFNFIYCFLGNLFCKYYHNNNTTILSLKRLPILFFFIPIHFSKLTASGLGICVCVCVFSLKMAVSLFKIYNYFWVYKLISYL